MEISNHYHLFQFGSVCSCILDTLRFMKISDKSHPMNHVRNNYDLSIYLMTLLMDASQNYGQPHFVYPVSLMLSLALGTKQKVNFFFLITKLWLYRNINGKTQSDLHLSLAHSQYPIIQLHWLYIWKFTWIQTCSILLPRFRHTYILLWS